jgi:hypothetical protein
MIQEQQREVAFMAYYYQTLRDIPMEFRRYGKFDLTIGGTATRNVNPGDMIFILFLFLMMRDEPYANDPVS